MQKIMSKQTLLYICLALIAYSLAKQHHQPARVDTVWFVYQSEDMSLPPYVVGSFIPLNELGLEVRAVDVDVHDGNDMDDITALDAAKQFGLPAMVLTNGDAVQRTTSFPGSLDEILDEVN